MLDMAPRLNPSQDRTCQCSDRESGRRDPVSEDSSFVPMEPIPDIREAAPCSGCSNEPPSSSEEVPAENFVVRVVRPPVQRARRRQYPHTMQLAAIPRDVGGEAEDAGQDSDELGPPSTGSACPNSGTGGGVEWGGRSSGGRPRSPGGSS